MTSGSILIMKALERNSTLTNLKVNNIVANECIFVSIAKCIEINKSLKRIEMQEVDCLD